MTVPDATAPAAEDVIAEALAACVVRCPVCGTERGYCPGGGYHRARQAAAVVAAIRGMSAAQLVDLRPDLTIEEQTRTRDGAPPISLGTPLGRQVAERLGHPIEARVVGPWQVTP